MFTHTSIKSTSSSPLKQPQIIILNAYKYDSDEVNMEIEKTVW